MRPHAIQYILTKFDRIASIGISSNYSPELNDRIKRLNQAFLVALFGFIPNTIAEILFNVPYTVILDFCFIAATIASFLVNKTGKSKAAIILFYCAANATILIGNIIEGVEAGNYILCIPVIMSGTLFVNMITEKKELILFFFISIITALLSFFVAPYKSTVQDIPQNIIQMMFVGNYIFSIVVAIIITLLILDFRSNREKHIVNEKSFKDAIFNNTVNAVIITKFDFADVHDCNERCLELFKVKNASDLKYFNILKQIQETLRTDLLHKNMEQPKSIFDLKWSKEIVFNRKNEDSFIGKVDLVAFNYNEGIYYLIGIDDITEMKKTISEKLKADEKAAKAVKTKSTFLSNISHELRTPLNGIIGTTNLLMQDENKKYFEEQFKLLKHSSEHMLSLINDVLDFSKLDADKMTLDYNTFNLKTNLQNICSIFEPLFAEKQIGFVAKIDAGLDRDVIGDDLRLNQVLNNLLSNALKFTLKGGVTIQAKMTEADSEKIRVDFSVQDSGIGIADNKLQSVFESFTQADANTTRFFGGTGLGLTISKKLTSLMGEALQVESEEGKGSRFFFSVTFKSVGKRTYVNEEANKELKSLEGVSILLAEDNAVNLMIARKFLQKWNVQITEATDGLQAINLFAIDKHQILLMDLEMPGIDGYSALAEIRKLNPDIPAIAFTAAAFEDMAAFLKQKGFNDYIQKPFRPEDLHAKISKQVNLLKAVN
jgi:signal transduction histidine kinase/CheY-like chemotaxis protein